MSRQKFDPFFEPARLYDDDLNERQGAHTHFNGLCDLLGVPKPTGTSLMDQGCGYTDVPRSPK
jgi:hypothetical protein